jgi:hypothetical protein
LTPFCGGVMMNYDTTIVVLEIAVDKLVRRVREFLR